MMRRPLSILVLAMLIAAAGALAATPATAPAAAPAATPPSPSSPSPSPSPSTRPATAPSASHAARELPPAQGPAVVIPIRGAINDFARRGLERRIAQARAAGARTLILELDTPGGDVGPTLAITRKLRSLTDLRTIAFVHDTAYSAGTMIALACDEVVMSPAAVMGDCAPIQVVGGRIESLGDAERAKAVSPILADFHASAQRNGYAPELVEALVRVEPVVYLLTDAAGTTFRAVNEADFRRLTGPGAASDEGWRSAPGVRSPVDGPDTLLTVHADEAIKLGLARSVAATAQELAASRGVPIVARLEPASGERVVELLNAPFARAILMVLFFTTLYLAMHTPGHGVAEAAAVLLLAALVGIPMLTGYAQWWEIALVLLGIALLALEIFVIPGFGVTGIAGILMIVGGLLMTFVAPEPGRGPLSLPSLPQGWTGLRNGLAVIVGSLLGSLLMIAWLRTILPRLPYFRHLILSTSVGGTPEAMAGTLTNIDPMDVHPGVGATGKALTDLKPGGSVEFRDRAGGVHVVAVVSDSGYVPRGSSVVVREAAGNRIVVRPARPDDGDGPVGCA